jgi:hypothetical protein
MGTSCASHTFTIRKYPPDCQRKPLQEHLENSYSKTKIGLQNQIMNTMDMWRRKEKQDKTTINNSMELIFAKYYLQTQNISFTKSVTEIA